MHISIFSRFGGYKQYIRFRNKKRVYEMLSGKLLFSYHSFYAHIAHFNTFIEYIFIK